MNCLEPIDPLLRTLISLFFLGPPVVIGLCVTYLFGRRVQRKYTGVRSATSALDKTGSQAKAMDEALTLVPGVIAWAISAYFFMELSYVVLC